MNPIRTDACNTTFTAPGCEDLPACVGEDQVSTYWRPSPEELADLNAGFPVRITHPGQRLMPMAVDTEPY